MPPRSSTSPARTPSRRTCGRAARTGSSVPTGSSSTSTPPRQRFAEVRAAARALGDLLRDLGLTPFAMTTGSRGLHVVAPLRRTADYDEVRPFARDVAAALVETDPDDADGRVPSRPSRRAHLRRRRTQRLRPARGRALRGACAAERAGGHAAALGGARRRPPGSAGLDRHHDPRPPRGGRGSVARHRVACARSRPGAPRAAATRPSRARLRPCGRAASPSARR